MMTDIFSTFDIAEFTLFPRTLLFLSLISFILYIPYLSFMKSNKKKLIFNLLNSNSFDFIKLSSAKFIKGLTPSMMAMFIFILTFNYLGLIPYMFSSSSHIYFSMTLALPIWFMLIISSANYNLKATIAHLGPAGAPEWIMPFLTIIELISTLIRPLTLAMRLAGNMTAGHIFLGLFGMLSISLISFSPLYSFFAFIIQITFFTLEFAICFIQAYVFILLLSLYSNEHM